MDKEFLSANDLLFAKDALRRVSTIAAEFGVRNKSWTAGRLAAELFLASSALDIADASQLPQLQRRLPKLIKDLERVCVWPSDVNPQCPILHSIVRKGTGWAMQETEKRVQRRISAFVTDSRLVVEQYFEMLRLFSKCAIEVQHSDDDKASKVKAPDTEEYPGHVNAALYSVLKEHSLCTCTAGYRPETAGKGHNGRLRLRGDIIKEDGCVVFDILYSASPNSCDFWQDLQLIVPTKNNRKRVKYADEPGTGKPSPRRLERQRVIPPGSLCRIVGAKLRSRICCRVQDSALHQLHDGSPIIQHVDPGPSKSLRDILNTQRLSNRMKLILAFIVARSFWQYYDSPWMNTKWSSDTIHFLPERRVEEGGIDAIEQAVFFTSKPYFVINFADNSDGFMEFCDAYSVIYRYPRLLSLCIILLEIGRGQSLSVEETGQIEADLNKNWALAEQLVNRPKSYGEFEYPQYYNITASLLNRKLFDNCATTEHNTEDVDVAMRKAVIYQVVVAPLEKFLQDLGFADNMYSPNPMDLIGHGPVFNVPVPAPQTAQGIYSDEAKSARWQDDLVDQRFLQDQRGVTGNNFGNRTVIHQGDNHYYLPGQKIDRYAEDLRSSDPRHNKA